MYYMILPTLVFSDKFLFLNSKSWIHSWKTNCFPANVLRQKTELTSWCTATRQQRGRSWRGWWGRWRARSPARPFSLSSSAQAAIDRSSDAGKTSWTRWRRTSKSALAEFNTRLFSNVKGKDKNKTRWNVSTRPPRSTVSGSRLLWRTAPKEF